jgi:hypothetical protein
MAVDVPCVIVAPRLAANGVPEKGELVKFIARFSMSSSPEEEGHRGSPLALDEARLFFGARVAMRHRHHLTQSHPPSTPFVPSVAWSWVGYSWIGTEGCTMAAPGRAACRAGTVVGQPPDNDTNTLPDNPSCVWLYFN